ncbi:lipase 3-like [Battus philenor]|uniref:lipase 3-like n=1 Tax=Battus philenor TaxID=42288 RepID=UPI0035CF1FA3
MFRITRGRNCNKPTNKIPVLLMHGLLMSSDCWLDAGPEAGIAYLLSDLCYDLWVPNTRGNYYSKKHIKLNPEKDIDFWDFSPFEFGYYDLPAFINYILDHTRSSKINFVGHSQGCSSFAIMNSERPEYNSKIGVSVLMSPASRLTNMRSLFFRYLSNGYRVLMPFLHAIGIYEALPLGGLVQSTAAYICKEPLLADTVCRLALGVIDSLHPKSIELETMMLLVSHFPAGTSVKNMAYYGQSVNVDDFLHYDYGIIKNLQMYGSVQPPPYNLSAVNVPAVILQGRNDFLNSKADVEWFSSKIPNVLEFFYVVEPLWNHFDFTYSRLSSKLVLPKINQYLQKYS